VARAQQPRRVSIIGVLWHAGNAEEEGSNFKALVKGFRDLGYVEGRNIILEHRFPKFTPDSHRQRRHPESSISRLGSIT
jgi:putative ABC transport system substrate-binding protein